MSARGASLVAVVEGARVVLFREAGRARAFVGRSPSNAGLFVFDVAPMAPREPIFPNGGPPFESGDDTAIVPLLVRSDRAWFSVVDRSAAAPGEQRVRLVERDASGRARVVERHEVSSGEERRPSLYDRAGKVAVVALGPSVYAFTRRALALAGPGTDLALFEEHADTECPPRKRCYPLRPRYDLTTLLGVAPDGSFVTADGGIVLRVTPTGARGFRYETYAPTGFVADDHVTLVHSASTPPNVVRWLPPTPPTGTGLTPSVRDHASELPLGARSVVGEGAFEVVTEDASGDVYGIRSDGALVRLSGGTGEPLYTPADGCRATDVVGAGEHAVAWIVTCEAARENARHFVLTHGAPPAPGGGGDR